MINIKAAEMIGKRKISKKSLADATDIRPATLGALWQGKTKRLDIDHLNELCKVLDCQP